VLDPFVGTGTSLRVARELGLTALGIEQDSEWCHVAAAAKK
jgi:DNA modification methylase